MALLKDPCPGFGRSAHYVSWHPDGGRRLAVAYCIMVTIHSEWPLFVEGFAR